MQDRSLQPVDQAAANVLRTVVDLLRASSGLVADADGAVIARDGDNKSIHSLPQPFLTHVRMVDKLCIPDLRLSPFGRAGGLGHRVVTVLCVRITIERGSSLYFYVERDCIHPFNAIDLKFLQDTVRQTWRDQSSTLRSAGVHSVMPTLHKDKLLILLAEDEPVSQKIAKSLLERAGHAVIACADGREAVDQVAQGDYDLVLMDIRMPRMNGQEATRRIRALSDPQQANVPIIALTSTLVDTDVEQFRADGFTAVLSKPLEWTAVQSVLQSLHGGPDATPRDMIEVNLQSDGYPWGQLPILDQNHLGVLRHAMGNTRLAQLCATARRSIESTADSLRSHWQGGQRLEAIESAHRLAGVAANFGCSALAALASQAERDFRDGSSGPAYFSDLDQLVHASLSELSA